MVDGKQHTAPRRRVKDRARRANADDNAVVANLMQHFATDFRLADQTYAELLEVARREGVQREELQKMHSAFTAF